MATYSTHIKAESFIKDQADATGELGMIGRREKGVRNAGTKLGGDTQFLGNKFCSYILARDQQTVR